MDSFFAYYNLSITDSLIKLYNKSRESVQRRWYVIKNCSKLIILFYLRKDLDYEKDTYDSIITNNDDCHFICGMFHRLC